MLEAGVVACVLISLDAGQTRSAVAGKAEEAERARHEDDSIAALRREGNSLGHGEAIIISIMTVTIDADVLAQLEEKAKKESREVDAVVNELLRQALGEKKPYKLELKGWGWETELLVDVADRKKLHELLDDDPEYLKKRGFTT